MHEQQPQHEAPQLHGRGLHIDLSLDEASGGLSYADYAITFTKPGEFAVIDSTAPDAHANMTLVVSGA